MVKDLKKNWRRVTRAAVVSILGMASTYVYFEAGFRDRERQNKDPIAILVRAVNEVERKPMKRIIWENVEENEVLYPGESIRTSDVSEASIKFIRGGAQIELEPDSLIVLGENAGSLALNCLKGKLFVADSGAADQDLKITSGKSVVNVAELKKTGGTVTAEGEATETALKVTGPVPYKAVYLNTVSHEKMAFEFEKLDDTYQLQLEAGPTPKKMKPVTGATATGVAGRLDVAMRVGPFYWRVVATSTDPKKVPRRSGVQKNEVIARMPPSLLEPALGSSIVWNPEEPAVTFRWSNLARLEKMIFDLSKTPDFKNPLVPDGVGDRTSHEVELKESGTYYWRVRGQLRGSQEQLVSESFKFQYKREFELLPPVLSKPANNERLSHQMLIASKLTLKWEEVPGVSGYKVSLKAAGGASAIQVNEEVKIPEIKVAGLTPGSYIWTVASVGREGKISAPAVERKFSVDELPKLLWADGKDDPMNYLYTTEKPSLKLEWPRGPAQAKGWKMRIMEDGADPSEAKWTEMLPEPKYAGDLSKAGKYEVEVEAFTETGDLAAKSSKRVVNVQQLPLLPAPKFAESVPEELMAKNNGSVQLAWEKVDRASRYVVEVRKPDGTVAKEVVSDNLGETIKSMMPGQYKVILKSVDQTGRRGIASEGRPLLVPDRSDARAPKIKAIKVK
ncbi:MAG: hypothetical protein ABL958_10720 [Bdellovibrionia bacterium]